MKKTMITLLICLAAMAVCALPGYTDCGKCDSDKEHKDRDNSLNPGCEGKVRELFEDITLLNLVNGLNFTEEQVKHILECNKKARTVEKEMEAGNEWVFNEIISAYKELKSALENNEGIPKDIERRAVAMEDEANKIRKGYMDSVASIERELTNVLLEAQVEVINTFNPCLIPPKDLKDPVRAGQAQDSQQGLDMLRRIRRIPSEVFEEKKSKIVERHLETVQKHAGKLTDEEKKQEKERFLKAMEKARAMSDKEFELNGPDLAREFIAESKKTIGKDKQMREELEKMHQDRRGGPGRVGRYLLNPKIVPILEKRLELLKNPRKLPPVDLDND